MERNQWRDSSKYSIHVSDSDDEVPGSLNASEASKFSSVSSSFMSKRKINESPTIIDATESEDEDEDNDEEEEEEEENDEDKIEDANDSSYKIDDRSLSRYNEDNSSDSDVSDVAQPIKKSSRIRRFRIEDSSSDSIVDIDDSVDDGESEENLPLTISDSSAPDIAISLAKEEARANVMDPLIMQQRVLTTYKLEQLKGDLLKAKTLYNTANREQLPDHGEKLRLSILSIEDHIEKLNLELEYTPINNSNLSTHSIKSVSSEGSPTVEPDFYIPLSGKQGKELGKKALATYEKEKALTVERITHLQQSLNRCPEENEEAENPRGIKTNLMPHQKHALAWMLWREKEKPPGGLLADDMGLGKTLTMISLVVATKDESYSDDSGSEEDEDEMWSSHKKFGRPKGGTLVVCPASLLDQWQNEVTNRCKRGVLTVEIHHGPRRENVAKRLAKNDMVITTYQIVSSEFKKNSTLFKIRWKRVILDEAHVIRNHSGKISEAACSLVTRNRWALTGTPIHNKEQDLYALLKFLRVSPFSDLQVWKRWVDNKNATGLKRLSTVTKSLMLRRTKQELIAKGTLEELPEKFTTSITINLDSEETKIYQIVLAFSQKLFAQFLTQRAEKKHMLDLNAGKFDKPSYMANIPESQFVAAQKQLLGRKGEDVKAHHILVLILRLRQICCHPGLIREMLTRDEVETNGLTNEEDDNIDNLAAEVNNMTLFEDEENEEENEENLFSLKNPIFDFNRRSSKIEAIIKTVQEILKKGEKMIIVSQWTGMLGIIAEHLSVIEDANYEMFSGSVAVKKRQSIIDRFNDAGDDLSILLLSLTAGGVGLNLVGGNHLLLIDIHWNPQLESQAQDRVYRFGQKKNVHVYKFLCNETIEQRVKELQDKKLNLAEDIFTGHRRTSNKLSLDDLKSIFEM